MGSKNMSVGVLALQGAFAKHGEMLERLGVKAIYVRKPDDLLACDGLIIPGGESTTMFRRIDFIELSEPLRRFAEKKAIFGTCAGLILMAGEIVGGDRMPFKLLDATVERNAFGRQAESFRIEVDVTFNSKEKKRIPAIFIRAPRIRRVGPEVEVLATFGQEPILIRQGVHLGATFHPELTDDVTIHRHFLQNLQK